MAAPMPAKRPARKTAAKRTPAKRAGKRPAVKKGVGKKRVAKKPISKKGAAKKPVAKKRPVQVAKKRAAQKPDGTPYTTTSTFSPRLMDLHATLDKHVRRLFRNVEPRYDYDMMGWRAPRAKRIESWKGTIDPNHLHLYVAERKQGITIHLWDPTDPYMLKEHAKDLTAAGFKVMVGCLNYNRKGDVPVDEVVRLLEETASRFKAEA